MRLLLLHPDVAARSCGDCSKWLYADKPGEFAPEPVKRGGRPADRPPNVKPPCSWCPKQPADVADRDRTPATAVELDARGWRAYGHYLECKAVGAFPDDDVVRRHAALIRQAEEVAADVRRTRLAVLPFSLFRGT